MNKPLQEELWENIQNFALDDPASDLPFSKKLAQENNWSASFTNTAIAEYRKFMFLCCILPNGAAPSETVDKVWHLHLTYTTNYWISFCRNTLKKEVHHFPSRGGAAEKLRHVNWYHQTLANYLEVFGYAPPAGCWPPGPPKVVDPPIIIYEPALFKRTITTFLVCVVISLMIVQPFHRSGPFFLIYYFLLILSGLAVSGILQRHKSARLNSFIAELTPANFTPFQIAFFLYKKHRAYQAALVHLLQQNIITIAGDRCQLKAQPPSNALVEDNPLLPQLTTRLAPGEIFSYNGGLEFLDTEKLQHPGFSRLLKLSEKIDPFKLIVPSCVLVVGLVRLLQGMSNDKPVSFLVLEMGVFSLVSLMIAAQYSYTYLVFQKVETNWKTTNNSGYGDSVLNNFTLLGMAALSGLAEYALLGKIIERYAPIVASTQGTYAGFDAGDSSTSDGGSCGSSCGGGCGGCGGGD